MKHISRIAIVSSIAVLALASCQKNEFVPEHTTSKGLTFSSVKPVLEDETKTAWNGRSIQWSKDDAIRVAYTCDGVWQNADGTATAESKNAKMYQSTALSANAETAQFTVPGAFKGTAGGSYVFYGAYPASACTDGSNFKYAPSLTVTIPETQTPAAESFDSAADFMLGTSVNTYTGIPTEAVSMSWDRMVAHAQLTFKTLKGFTAGETISKVELTADSEADMVGKHYIYLDTKKVTKPNGTVTNALTINGTNISVDATGTFVAWASFLPCTVKSLKVVVTTNKATYTREIASCELVFKKNARNVLTINMSSAIREVIGVASLPFEETFDAITTGSSTSTGGSGTKVDAEQMANFSNYADATYQAGGAVRIGKSGSLETKNLDLSKDFYVVVTAKGWSASEVNLTVSAGEQSKTVTLETYIGGDYKDYTIYFNAVSSSSTVKFTTGSTRCFIDNIRIAEGSDPREPLTAPKNLSCTKQTANSLTFSWDAVANATGYQVSKDGGNTYGATQSETSYTWTGLSATTTKTLYVKAIGDGISYTDSEAASASGTTTAASPGEEEKSEKIVLANGTYSGSGETGKITWSGTSCSFVQTKESSTTNVNKSYVSAPRWYASHKVTFTANTGYTITKVVVVCTSSNYADALGGATYSAGANASVSGSTVTITTSGNFNVKMGAQSRISSVTVYYKESAN